ncbi:MAG: SMEK domain-containing protein [Aliarcobacter sp.]|nr:SMEK domain-containing protein [Aliarcobacter sp.]
MIEQTIKNLIKDITFIKEYIKTNQESGFNDMTRILESISLHIFNVTHSLNLVNKNQSKANFPAIDLVDDNKRIAIQVTINADSKKIRNTIEKFEKFGLNNNYEKLYIFGFLECKKAEKHPAYCELFNIGDLISRLTDMNNEEKVQNIIDIIEQHTDFSKIHPYDDINCLKIVLNCIDRNAIKHKMYCEGSYIDMIKGLDEISELIGKGTINKKTKGKSLDDFNNEEIKNFLQNIKNKIGEIKAIVNKSRKKGSDFVNIVEGDYHEIDKIKLEIIELSNEISSKYDCGLIIKVLD